MAWQSLHDIYSTKVLSPVKQESTEIKLSDVYSEQVVRDNNATTLESRPKEWRSLSDVYTEAATVTIKFSGEDNTTEKPYVFTLSDVYAREVLRHASFSENDLYKKITDWAAAGKWSKYGVKRISEQINSILIDVFPDIINNPEEIKKIANEIDLIMKFKESKPFAKFIIPKDTQGAPAKDPEGNLLPPEDDLFKLFTIEGVTILGDSKFISALCQIDFAEGKVGVGPGEAAITLFTEATNPTKGDLETEDTGVVELKGTNGRIGKGRKEQAVYAGSIDKSINAESIKRQQEAEFAKLIELRGPKSNNRIQEFKLVGSRLPGFINSFYESNDLDDFLKRMKSFFKKPTKKDVPVVAVKGEGEDDGRFPRESETNDLLRQLKALVPKEQGKASELEEFKKVAADLIERASNIYKYKLGAETLKFRAFFTKDIVDYNKKLHTIYKYVADGEITDSIKAIIKNAYDNKIPAENIIGAITVANYQKSEGFKYIIYANTTPGTIQGGTIPCRVVGRFTDSYEDNLKLVFNSIDGLHFDPNADRGGFQVQYMGAPRSAQASTPAPADNSAVGVNTLPSEGDRLNIAI
jgi:hypothetical protein